MDYEWAEAVLEQWLNDVRILTRGEDPVSDSPAVQKLLEREDQVRRVVARVNDSPELPALVVRVSGMYAFNIHKHKVRYALGKLRTDEETTQKLGTSAPQMAADALHPTVWQAASKLWSGDHYGEAVQRAATFLNAEIQSRISRTDLSDVALMQEAFSANPPAPGRPRLRWPGADDDLTVRSMREGIRNFSVGCYQTIRNPSTHSTASLTRQEGLERLTALSLLAGWADNCELVTVTDPAT